MSSGVIWGHRQPQIYDKQLDTPPSLWVFRVLCVCVCASVFVSALHMWPHVVPPTVYHSRLSYVFPSGLNRLTSRWGICSRLTRWRCKLTSVFRQLFFLVAKWTFVNQRGSTLRTTKPTHSWNFSIKSNCHVPVGFSFSLETHLESTAFIFSAHPVLTASVPRPVRFCSCFFYCCVLGLLSSDFVFNIYFATLPFWYFFCYWISPIKDLLVLLTPAFYPASSARGSEPRTYPNTHNVPSSNVVS